MNHTSLVKPILFAIAGFSLWAIADALVRVLKDYPSQFIAFTASFVALMLLFIFANRLGGWHKTFTQPKLKLRILRGFVLSCAGPLSYIAFTQLELPTAYAFIFMAPIFAKILSIFMTKEMISARSWLITTMGFIGVLIVLRPGVVPLNIGTLSALGLAFFFALGYVMGRFIGNEHQTPLSLALFTYFFITLWTALPAWFAYQNLSPDTPVSLEFIAIILIIGVFSFIGSPIVGKAYACAPSAYIAPIHYIQMIWGIALGALMFDEYPDIYTLTGGSIIIAAGLLLIRYSRKPL